MDRIRLDPIRPAIRMCIDGAVHQAVGRFSDDIKPIEGLVYRIAQAAAESAVEQFCSYANAELAIIKIEWDRRADELSLKPIALNEFFKP